MSDIQTRTFADLDGDEVSFQRWPDGHIYGGKVWLTDKREDNEWCFDLKTTEQIADALYELAGAGAPSKGGTVRASAISFNEGILRVAAVHGKTVTFRYVKENSTVIETRSITPEKVEYIDGNVVVTGVDPDREDYRAYRLDRITGEVKIGLLV